jgi:hypothetical protein
MNLRKQTRLLEEGNKKSYLGAKSGEERMACTLLVTLRRKGGGVEDEVSAAWVELHPVRAWGVEHRRLFPQKHQYGDTDTIFKK